MIESLRVKNFQAHEDFTLELSDGVTCVRGPSDSGKTALLRALRWVCCNEPRGDSFVRHGGESCEVSLSVDGRDVTRFRGKGENSYSLDGEEYRAFGNGVPDPVSSLLALDPGVNFQAQLEPLFWLSKSPGEAARALNRVVSLDKVDAVLDRASSEVRKATTLLEAAEERLKAAEAVRDSLEWVVEAHAQAEALSSREKGLDVRLAALREVDRLLAKESLIRFHLSWLGESLAELKAIHDGFANLAGRAGGLARAASLSEEARVLCLKESTLSRECGQLEESLSELTRTTCPACGRPPSRSVRRTGT